MIATPWLASDPYAMLGRSPSQVGAYQHPQTRIAVATAGRQGSHSRAAAGRRPACARSASKSRSAWTESITPRVAADESQVVRLVLVGDAAALVALAVPELDVHRARRTAASGSSAPPG